MTHKGRQIIAVCLGGLFLLFDQIFKQLARTSPHTTWYLIKPWLGWEYFANSGVAFNIPIPNTIIIFITPLILFFLLQWGIKKSATSPAIIPALIGIGGGAISNFIDRVLFGITIDYLRIFTAIINLGDIMVVVGVAILLRSYWKKT